MADEINKTQTTTTTPLTNEVDPVFAQIEGELKTRFELLPTELQEVILSSDYQMKLFEIAKKHKLTYEKLGQLELETTMVILGMTPPDEYKAEIAEQMQLAGADLDSVVMEINDQIFSPIREKLMGIYTEEEVKKGEEFAKVTANPNAVIEKQNTPISIAGVPSSIKNTDDTKKEVGAPVTQASVGSDPYRELPDNTLTPAPVVPTTPPSTQTPTLNPTQPTKQSGVDTKITQEFLKTIPVLGKDTKNKSDIEKEQGPFVEGKSGASEVLRSEEILSTPIVTSTTTKTKEAQTQSETLQNIASLKNTLSATLEPKNQPTQLLENTPEPQPVSAQAKTKPTSDVSSPVTQPITQETPVITKEIQSDTVSKTMSGIKTSFAPLPPIASKGEAQTLTPDTTPTTPKFSSEETGELVRNIKLQIDENKSTPAEASPIQPETLQKIDSMIDFKKAGSFMGKEGGIAHVGENFSGATFQKPVAQEIKTPNTPTARPTTPEKGHIFDKDIENLKTPVKKTGFFGKLKNFFGGKEKIINTDVAPQPVDTTVHQFTGMPTAIRPEGALQPTPVQTPAPTASTTPTQAVPPGVDDVKIFDEITVVKK